MQGQKFKEGDVVELKSRGPKMTVREYVKKTDMQGTEIGIDVVCTWFSGDEMMSGNFKEGQLMIDQKSGGGVSYL